MKRTKSLLTGSFKLTPKPTPQPSPWSSEWLPVCMVWRGASGSHISAKWQDTNKRKEVSDLMVRRGPHACICACADEHPPVVSGKSKGGTRCRENTTRPAWPELIALRVYYFLGILHSCAHGSGSPTDPGEHVVSPPAVSAVSRVSRARNA